ncbi:ABC transporter substrate-binding protein [Paraglaciecola marina]|uniref:ABC transporter substrate-binding protein n=1 Tax=Paraglaciecola marina TaxID=2500157 RepID=UPI001EF123A0|nr:ABC transporter substrate-binding protein [Paraglaciecola marina]
MQKPLFPRVILAVCFFCASSQAARMDEVTFQLDWLPGGDKAPLYVAIGKGFFAEQNIKVKISHGKGSSDSLTKLGVGIADVGYADLSSLLAAKAQEPLAVSAIMSVFSKAPHAFFSLKGSGIESVTDVKGKRVATSAFSSSVVFLPLLLNLNSIPKDSIRIIKVDAGALGPMLATGNTDVIISWMTDTVKYQSQVAIVGKELHVMPWYDAGLEFYSTVIVGTDKFLKARPDVAKRFLVAFQKAIEFTWAYPKESAAIVHDLVPEVDTQIALDTIINIRSLVYNNASDAHGLGIINSERLATSWSYVAQSQGFELDAIDPEEAINRSFMKAISPVTTNSEEKTGYLKVESK